MLYFKLTADFDSINIETRLKLNMATGMSRILTAVIMTCHSMTNKSSAETSVEIAS